MNNQLKTKIMHRVYLTWFFNRSKLVLFLQLPLIILFLTIQHQYVAFKAVASNGLNSLASPNNAFEYFVSAFQNAEPLVVFLAAAIGLFTVLATASILRNIAVLAKKPKILPFKVEK